MSERADVIIVGAGFSGVGLAIRLKEAGKRNVVILEKGDGVGGTWRDNTYPGCACDVPAHLYSYSFALSGQWSQFFAPQPEILSYIEGCVERYGLGPWMRFGHTVTGASFDAERGLWRVDIEGKPSIEAPHLALGVGGLHIPQMPPIHGLEDFSGPLFHSSRYDHNVSLKGKRVAVIGTGASAIQLVPELAQRAEHLTVYQRTPPWVIRRPDRDFGPRARSALERTPGLNRALRAAIYAWMELRGVGFTAAPGIMEKAKLLGLSNIARGIPDDPALRRAVTPDYTPGCKRVLMSNTYYPALAQRNVELVTSPISGVDGDVLETEDGARREADVVICATGFAVADFLSAVDVRGLGGASLNATWSSIPRAYLGTFVAGFPNLYLLMGPNTGLGHNSMVFMLEAQMRLILDVMRGMERHGARYAALEPEAELSYNRALQRRLSRGVWASGCQSWYLDAAGQNATLWPGTTMEFWWRTRRWKRRDFRLV